MSSINHKTVREPVTTHGGALTYAVKDEEKLYRSVMSCMLWEDTHYEDGQSIADRIQDLVAKVDPLRVAQIAIDARTLMKLRHVPLLIARSMARLDTHKHLVSKLLPEIIQRPDELTEFLAIYWALPKEEKEYKARGTNYVLKHKSASNVKLKKEPLSAQVKKGLAAALNKFEEYALAKYNRDGTVKLRDVLFLTHAKPETGVEGFTKNARKRHAAFPKDTGSILFRKVVENTLETPDTWEVELSAKGNNKESWERLLRENKLAGLAIIRNLRNMIQQNVDESLVRESLLKMNGSKVLPFRYLSAAIHAPKFEPELELAMFKCLEGKEKIKGKTILIVDVSGSMYSSKISQKSEMDRAKAACALAVLVRELCENPVIYATAGNDGSRIHKTKLVPSRRGFALSDAIYNLCHPLGGGGIFLTQVMNYVKEHESAADRIIVITDEQDCSSGAADAPDKANAFGTHNYIINVNTYEHGIGFGKWTKINGWSEAVLDYIRLSEEGYKSREISQNVYKMVEPRIVYAKTVKTAAKKSNRSTRKNVSGN